MELEAGFMEVLCAAGAGVVVTDDGVTDPALLERSLSDCASGTRSHDGERLALRSSVRPAAGPDRVIGLSM